MSKAKTSFRNRRPKKDPYNKVLIVCEGLKTEPNYFQESINKYRINTANVAIVGNSGSSPKSVVEYALDLYGSEKRKGDAFDQVFCVFDKDSHSTYQWAKDFVINTDEKLRNKLIKEGTLSKQDNKITIFNATTTVPCFEYWLLLHFTYTAKPYFVAGKKSSCKCVINDLKKHLPAYKKSQVGIFDLLFDKLETAKRNAKKANLAAKSAGTDNPTTQVHELLEILQNIKKES